MLKFALYIPIFVAGVALSACSQGSTATNPIGPTGAAQPSHRVKPDITSTTVTIENTYSSAVDLLHLSSACLTGSPPSSVAANSTSSPFTVSYTGSCTIPTGYFNMTYGPNGALVDACIFNISYDVTAGTFSYSVANHANTNCSFALGATPGTVQFTYSHI
jgi:hypothetical protein